MADANSHNKHHYPQYKKGDNYELFKTKLNYWAKITSLAKAKQGLAIALYSLPENDESMIYEKVMREIPQADLEKEKLEALKKKRMAEVGRKRKGNK